MPAASTSSLWTKIAVGSTVALLTSATLLSHIIKAPQMEAGSNSSSSLSPLTGGSIVQDLKNEHNRIGVEKKSTSDLLLSMLVYKMCTFSLLVRLAPKLIELAEMMHLSPVAYWVVRKTFFAQFCGGETADDCIGTMNALRSAGINSILDLSIEADLDQSDLEIQTPDEIRARFNKSADNIAEQISTCIETASNMSKSFAAIKITAMGSPLLLQQVSSTLSILQERFRNIDQDHDGKVTKDEFKQLVKMLPNPAQDQKSLDILVDQLFKEADVDKDGRIDWVDFASTISLNREETRSLFTMKTEGMKFETIPGLIEEDLEDYKRLLERMEKLCDQAEKSQTRLMIDAEQTYFQPAIDNVALHLQENYNHTPHVDGPLIYNTYQMYLKDALGRLQQDYTRAQRNGYVLAAKLVRGAYMVSERKRAQDLGLLDPICDDIEATHASYNAGVDFMLGEMTRKQDETKAKSEAKKDKSESSEISLESSPVVLFVASHNKDSVIRTCGRMQELGLSPQSGLVMFGQLMGMCDQISYTLGQHGYGIYKYVPYGPIHHVIPYLIRRAQENASVLGGVAVEHNLLSEELRARFMPQKPRAQIQAGSIASPGSATTMYIYNTCALVSRDGGKKNNLLLKVHDKRASSKQSKYRQEEAPEKWTSSPLEQKWTGRFSAFRHGLPGGMVFDLSPRPKFPERFQPRDRFRPPESLKNSPAMIDHSGQPPAASRHFGPSSAPSGSSISHPRDFSPPANYKTSINEPNGGRPMDYYSGVSPNMGPNIGLGLGPARYGDRDDWRGRPNQFPREFERDREFRNRDIRQDIRDMRDSRPPRDPRDTRDPRDAPLRERETRDRDMIYQRDPDYRERDPRDRDLRDVGITTRELRDRDNRERDPRERGSWNNDVKGREVPDQDVRELVERERERERERDRERDRDRNRERPIWLRDLDKDLDGNIPTRPALDHINRERDRERERPTNSRPMTRVQELDRDLLAYTSDKPRQTFGKTEEVPHGADRGVMKPGSHPNASFVNSQREPKQQDGDDMRDRDRFRDRDRLYSRENERDNFSREPGVDRDQQRDRERDFYNRPDGAGLRSDIDNRQRNTIIGSRPRVLSAPTLDDISYGESFGPQSRNLHDRSSYPNSPATAIGVFPDRVERGERQDDRRQGRRVPSYSDPSTMNPPSNQGPQAIMRSEREEDQHGNVAIENSKRLFLQLCRSNEGLAKGPSTDSPAIHIDVKPKQEAVEQAQPEKGDSERPSQGTTYHVNLDDSNGNADANTTNTAPEEAVVLQETLNTISLLEKMDDSVHLKNVGGSTSANGVITANDSGSIKSVRSPSMTSLPSPGLSPIQEVMAIDAPREPEEFESHSDILKKIDSIDGKIQQVEDLLLKHRQQKEQLKVETQLANPVDPEDEDIAIDVEQPDAESVVEDTPMEMDNTSVLASMVAFQDNLKSEDLLMNGRDAPSPADLVPDKDMEDTRLEIIDSEDVDMAASDAEVGKDRRRQIIQQFSRQELQHAIDEDDPFYKRKEQQKRRPQLYDQIYAENNTRAKKYGRVHSALGSSREHGQSHHHQSEQAKTQIYESVEDYPFYQQNIESHLQIRNSMIRYMATKAATLDEKELELKREYKQHWESWVKKVEKLDKIKEKMSNAPLPPNAREEDLVQSDNVLFTTRNRRGAYNSDAVRSEAELMEIIQSLENADMRNPDLRASRTAATVPPMILDPQIREKVHYFDRNHLVTDPTKYYRLGPVTDTWTEEERQIFIKRYLNYPKQFGKIAAGIENKTASQCVLFYYREKKKIGFKDMVSNRGRKRKPAAGKRKEKVVQQPSPSGQPGKKHKGSALIEDIGQANRKMAKSKEVRELHDLHSNWADFDGEPVTRRRVRSDVVGQQSSTANLDESSSNVASPALSAVSTPSNAIGERRKQRSKATNTRSSTAAASNAKALTEEVAVEEKKPKTEKATPASVAVASTNAKTIPKIDETITAVDPPKVGPTPASKQSQVAAPEPSGVNVGGVSALPALPIGGGGGVTRWTAAEQEKCIAALKKYGRDLEAVANAVGTKTVDQCKNFRFNYKRKFGVSALDDTTNNDGTRLGEEGEDKEASVVGAEKNKPKRGRAGSSTAAPTPNTPQSAAASGNKDAVTTPSGRRKVGKPSVQEAVKDDSPKVLPTPTNNTEEPEVTADKRRRKRAASKSETGGTPTEPAPAPSGTSFRARYSRDPSEASSPSIPAVSQAEDQFVGQANVDGSVRRSNFSSYWSRQEKIDFTRLLSLHGKDWDKISKAMKTKTLIQVRNHYSNNAEKLAADGIIGIERPDSVPPSFKENEETSPESNGMQQINESGHPDQEIGERDGEHGPTEYHSSVGPKSGYFMPPSHGDDNDESRQEEAPRTDTPPRRITNIGNLLNNDDEDVNVAVEDWFGNTEEGNNAYSPENPHEADGVLVKEQGPNQSLPQHNAHGHYRMGEEDVETEDEYEVAHNTPSIYGSNVPGAQKLSHRHSSEANASAVRQSYPSGASTVPAYYNHPQHQPHPSHLHSGHAVPGVLGSPYDSQHYYRSSSHASGGYRSPPPPVSPTLGSRPLQRMKSPSVSLPSGPSSAVMQPSHYSHVSHHQHQRSSSIGIVDIVPRSNASPGPRDRSPMPHQGSYFTQPQSHGYAQSPSHVQFGYAQHHSSHHPSQMEVMSTHSRHIREPSMPLQHPPSSSNVGHGHSHSLSHSLSSHSHGRGHNYGHSHSGSVSRYSGSPQLPGSGSIRGSPGPVGPSAGPGSPAHLGHGGHLPSRYSPIPTSSVSSGSNMSEPPVHHSQHHYQQHMRRSSSPFQHHISGQIPPPSYLQAPPSVMHSSSAPKHQQSSFGYGPSTPTSLLPPPLPPSSVAVSSAAYHPGHQQQPSFGHSHHSASPYGTPPPHHHQQQSSRHHHPQ
ncbi:hypothetical protein BGX27_008068 [Mortierella sp. AM989]|nr:hypothetical protein BGX27_008068 [Mortierella sp. AM989]